MTYIPRDSHAAPHTSTLQRGRFESRTRLSRSLFSPLLSIRARFISSAPCGCLVPALSRFDSGFRGSGWFPTCRGPQVVHSTPSSFRLRVTPRLRGPFRPRCVGWWDRFGSKGTLSDVLVGDGLRRGAIGRGRHARAAPGPLPDERQPTCLANYYRLGRCVGWVRRGGRVYLF